MHTARPRASRHGWLLDYQIVPYDGGARRGSWTRALLAACLCVNIVATATGIVKSLPYAAEPDEAQFVEPAWHIAATGDLDPHWLGHPGATVIYPLAAVYRMLFGGGMPVSIEGGTPSDVYMLGRGLSIAYEILSLPLVFLIGRQLFGAAAALIATWLVSILPIAVAHAQVVRTDSAGILFGLLGIWLSLRVVGQPSMHRVILAGFAVGLAIATRYFMASLVPLLLAFSLLARVRVSWLVLGCASVAFAFALASPYSLLDPPELQHSLRAELGKTTPGADGLSPTGNFVWYLTEALPSDLTWPLAALALVGILLAVRGHRPEHLLLLGYMAIYLTGISASLMHWHRWIIQILPILLLFGGYAVQTLVAHVTSRRVFAVAAVALVSIQPAYQLVVYDLQQGLAPQRVRSREWVMANIPAGTKLVSEGYGPPLGARYADTTTFTLSNAHTFIEYAARGYRYLIVSSAVYDRYFAEPERYADQLAFYNDLFTYGDLRAEFRSPLPNPELFRLLAGAECNCNLHPTRGGPSIRIYALHSDALSRR